ncbi:Cytosine-specific methyltransferase [Sulfitobacter noctilucae]|uniref:DNA cytosine methyltransferase n=1 Tax=Sulfitobacter noctilucae TaxID=1342302 RepID=UPI000468E95B|nr:DNA cytosine methyltransferase [Sulfitobacter noctilucae]KIN60843.1 Cytosine-specific methyltransferase [Sulfitobacter noctilucae]
MVSELNKSPRFAEFFCGGGMVRAGLGAGWTCAYANDIDPMKCATYRDNWGGEALVEGDIASIDPAPLMEHIDLYWASSPCQDFSLAGKGQGLRGKRSGVFTEWARHIGNAVEQGFAPRIIAFENVTGLMTRNAGSDLNAVLRQLVKLGYRVGALEIDAAHFLPQSRPRLFIVGVRQDLPLTGLSQSAASGPFHTPKIQAYARRLPKDLVRNWVWWHHTAPDAAPPALEQMIDSKPDTQWLNEAEVDRLFNMMSEPSENRMAKARKGRKTQIGMLYKRGRPDAEGQMRQRAEVRFDGLAGCLRTPGGGSSRQTVVFVRGNQTRARLLSSKEVARLMGLPDSYRMPARYNQAYQVAGDGVAVPIVSYLDQMLFQKMLAAAAARQVA